MAVRVLVINPSGEEDLGLLADVLKDENAVVEELATKESVDLLEAGSLPVPTVRVVQSFPGCSANYDCLIVLGSPLGVLTTPPASDAKAPQCPSAFIEETEKLLQDFHEQQKPVLGICLGAQLVARAFGGSVMKMPSDASHTALPSARETTTGVEFGFHDIEFAEESTSDPVIGRALQESYVESLKTTGKRAPPKFMQWHSDTFTYPPGAVPLSSRPTCQAQAFRLGKSTYAFQYHIEVGRELGSAWYQEYVEGKASHASCGAEDAVSSEADASAIQDHFQQVSSDGSVERGEHFTVSVMRSLLVEARRVRQENVFRCYSKRIAVAAIAVGTIAVVVQLARRRKQ